MLTLQVCATMPNIVYAESFDLGEKNLLIVVVEGDSVLDTSWPWIQVHCQSNRGQRLTEFLFEP